MARRQVSLRESLESTFENAPSGGRVILCVFFGIWWWITGIPECESTIDDAPDPSAVQRAAARATAKDGWYQLDGRWYCEAHDTLYCKRCPS